MTHTNEAEATVNNIEGVFSDLDEGGIDEDEALKAIRRLVGAKPPLSKIVLRVRVPGTITVDLSDGKVTEFELDYTASDINRTAAETRDGGDEIDDVLYSTEIQRAFNIAEDSRGGWPEPESM